MTVVAALPRMGGSHPVPSLSINPTERRVQQCTVCLCLCLIIVSCGVAQYSGLVGGIFGPWHSTTPPTCCNHHHMVMIIICHHHRVMIIRTVIILLILFCRQHNMISERSNRCHLRCWFLVLIQDETQGARMNDRIRMNGERPWKKTLIPRI